ncbi:hypothetical protein CYL18_14420 [Pradoshia eiseniae]|uniref:Lipoprotein n=1 Tax=Pradoshia eiseniae TaxID=2064768 RepID=A0A2S7MXC6_9BACI|nr:hypothetical protein [Pradoshia eiseniae]PQD94407.1 hypothetical protein CYL18_14420 [Pradoshia eiseniae]
MKKLMSIFMAMLLLIGLVGCSADAGSESKASEKTEPKQEQEEKEKTPLEIFKAEMKKMKGESDNILDNGDGTDRYTYYVPGDNGDTNFYAINVNRASGEVTKLEYDGNTADKYLLSYLELAEKLKMGESLVDDFNADKIEQNKDIEIEKEQYNDTYGYMNITPKIDIDSMEDNYKDNESMINDLIAMINKKEGVNVKLLGKEDNGYTTIYSVGIKYAMDEWDSEYENSVDIEVSNSEVGIEAVTYDPWVDITKDISDDTKLVIETIIEMIGTSEDIEDFNKNFSETMDISIPLDNGKHLEINTAEHGGIASFYIN